MKFSELKFKKHPSLNFGTQAKVKFSNNYGASIITGQAAYTDNEKPYELAVLHNGRLTYSTPITDDVCGYLDAQEVEELLAKIEALPEKEEGD